MGIPTWLKLLRMTCLLLFYNLCNPVHKLLLRCLFRLPSTQKHSKNTRAKQPFSPITRHNFFSHWTFYNLRNMSQVSSCSVAVPPHYFYSEGEADVINGLPNEIVSSVLDFADYGMLARLSCSSKPFRDILTECAVSRFDLAVAFLNGGGGLEKNPSMAVRHLRQIVSEEKTRDEEELTRSKYLLAQCYLTGNGIEKDLDEGLSWLEDAANVGDAVSAHYLATLYENGEFGVDLCPEKAASWFLFAAKLGHSESMAEYALHCELGVGVDQSDTEALDWYLRAAAAGHVEANFSIGECYEEAKGVPHDLSEACLWYFKSAQSGCDDSLKALKRLQDIARIVLPGVGRIFGA